jgi:DNA-binding NtrC family response regulator
MQITKLFNLERPDWEILSAENGQAGLEAAVKHQPEVVLTDINMPEMDGLKLLSEIRSGRSLTQVIVMTGRDDNDAPVKALRGGASDYLHKPLDIEEMLIAVDRALKRSKLEQQLRSYQEHLEQLVDDAVREKTRANQELRREIEENRKLEEQLRQTQKLEAVGILAGGIAHDFNNILFGIIGYGQLVLDDLEKDTQVWENQREVLGAASRAANLVKQILAFSRQAEHERTRVEPSMIIKEVLKLMRASLPANVKIEQSVEDKQALVLADSVHLHQIMMNLCTNAGHAIGQNDGILRVTQRIVEVDEGLAEPDISLKEGRYVQIAVRDTGCGMTEEIKSKIFDPFFTTKQVGVGTGMGLSVVHGIVSDMGGAITVDSTPGEGSTFSVYLPLVAASDAKAPAATHDAEVPRGTETIVYVDDEASLVDMGRQQLERLGYQVHGFTSSVEAFSFIRNHAEEVDALVTDQTMPDLSGLELVRSLATEGIQLPTVLCTGYSQNVDRELASESGIAEFMEKPVRIDQLAPALRRVLASPPPPLVSYARILVIDDEHMVKSVLSKQLSRAGHQVFLADNGRDGLEIMEREDIDIVLTDIYMPVKEGFETIAELRSRFPHVTIFAMSGGARRLKVGVDTLGVAGKLGASVVFSKPVKRELLLEAIQEQITNRG